MTGVMFTETLKRNLRGMVIWGLAVGAMVFLQIIAIPDVESLRQVTELLESLPPVLLQAFGAGDMEFVATPEGYLAINWFGIGVLIFCAYAASAGLRVTSSDEDTGVLDMVLTTPIPRWRLMIERTAAYALLAIGVIAIVFVFTYLAIIITPSMTVNMTSIVNAQLNMLPSTLFVLGVAVFIGGLVRRRGLAVALMIGFLAASYFLDTLGRAVPGAALENVRWLSFMRFYDAAAVMQTGLNWGAVAVLTGLGLVFTALGIVLFQRRDTGR